MSYRELSANEEKEMHGYFFSRGFDVAVAAERIVFTEHIAKSEKRPVLDVFRELTKDKLD